MTTVSSVQTVRDAPRERSQPAAWRRERAFFTIVPLAMFAVVIAGFAPTYYLKGLYGTPALSPLFHLHGLLFTSWMILLIAQPVLVSIRRTDIHRRIGRVGGWLTAAMGSSPADWGGAAIRLCTSG